MTGELVLTALITFAVVHVVLLARVTLAGAPWHRLAPAAGPSSIGGSVPVPATRPSPLVPAWAAGPAPSQGDGRREPGRPTELEVLSAAMGPADAARCRRPGCDHKRDHRRVPGPAVGTAESRPE